MFVIRVIYQIVAYKVVRFKSYLTFYKDQLSLNMPVFELLPHLNQPSTSSSGLNGKKDPEQSTRQELG